MNEKKWYNYFVSVEGAPDEASGAKPAASDRRAGQPTAAQRVADIASAVAPPSRPAAPVSPGASFDEIYRAADITTPPHGYTITKVAEMLRSAHIRELPPDVKRGAIMVALEAAGVKVEEVIQDAVRRDRALDTYEHVQQKGLEELEAAKREENRQIQADLDRLTAEYRSRMKANQDAVEKERQRLATWGQRKHEEEERIADAVSHFVTENPVTRTARPAPAAPSAPASGT